MNDEREAVVSAYPFSGQAMAGNRNRLPACDQKNAKNRSAENRCHFQQPDSIALIHSIKTVIEHQFRKQVDPGGTIRSSARPGSVQGAAQPAGREITGPA
jgi:hypothetical protein